MVPRPPRPRSAPERPRRTTGGAPRPLRDFPLQDADGRTLSLGDRVEQVSVDEDHGALRSRLHHHGKIIGRCTSIHKTVGGRSGRCLSIHKTVRGWL